MCGRFTLRTSLADLCTLFFPGFEMAWDDAVPAPPHYNIAPTQTIVTFVAHPKGGYRLMPMRWGLVPAWSDDLKIGVRMINARSESVDTKPSFRQSFRNRRCVIPADGYYEWKSTATGKQPYLIHRPSDVPFLLAGLWETNVKAKGVEIQTCTIITTSANDVTGAVHNRMPSMIMPDDLRNWLDPTFHDSIHLKSLLGPAANDLLVATAVSRHVNNARNNDPQCIRPHDS